MVDSDSYVVGQFLKTGFWQVVRPGGDMTSFRRSDIARNAATALREGIIAETDLTWFTPEQAGLLEMVMITAY